MAKAPAKDPFRCAECGWTTAKWVGRCGECQTWGSVEEVSAPKKLSLVPTSVTEAAKPIGEVSLEIAKARTSGVSELDRVLGGGLVPGAAILLAGEPGVGKSTLLLAVAAQTAAKGISAEIINIHTIKPIDEEAILKSVAKTKCVVTCEEHNRFGGLGDAVAQVIIKNTPVPQEYVAVNDSFGESGTPDQLMTKYGLDTMNIVEAAEKVLKRK